MYNEFKNLAFYDPLHETSATVPSDIVHFYGAFFWLVEQHGEAYRGYSEPRYERTMLF